MTAFVRSGLPALTLPARRPATPRAGQAAPPRDPPTGRSVPLDVTGTCACGWAQAGTHADWGSVWRATEKHSKTRGHYPVFRAEPAGGARRETRPVSATVIRQMKALRKAEHLTAAQLAERMTALGVPWKRDVVANLENGRRESVTVDEMFALALVFGVALVDLVTDPDDEEIPYMLSQRST